MNVIVCIDDNSGMLFHHRRQSSDCAVIKDMLDVVDQTSIWMNEYSAKLFGKENRNIFVDPDFLNKAGEKEFCFVENEPIQKYLGKIQQIIIYRWNRTYPADVYFEIQLNGWKRTCEIEFAGHSHEKITKEVYKREIVNE